MAGSTQAAMVLEKELRILHLDLQVAGSERRLPGLSMWNPKACPHWHTSSNEATPLHVCQVVPLPGDHDQAFKYMSLWGPFLSKPHNPHLWLPSTELRFGCCFILFWFNLTSSRIVWRITCNTLKRLHPAHCISYLLSKRQL